MSNQEQSAGNTPAKKNVPLRVLIIVIILAVGAGIAVYLKKTAPRAKKVAPVKQAQLVRIQQVVREDARAQVYSYGTVIAARTVVLKSQVSGQVVDINHKFGVGACLPMATPVLRIDPRDYQLDITRQQATLKKAQAALALEQGQQGVARHEWQMFLSNNESVSESAALALREPYLRQAEAEVSSAQAGLGQAQLALERTVIQLPFDALVLSKEVELGAQLVAQGAVATLVATDIFWLEVSIPVAQLPWLELPGVNSTVGAQAQVTTPSLTHPRIGRVVRLLGNLEEGGRMARLLIAINDPLDKNKPLGQRQPLLLGDYVDVVLNGRDLNDVIILSRNAVHDGNQVWVAQADNTLTIRTVEILWKDRTQIYIGGGEEGLQAGDQAIVSDLSAAVEGMAIRIDRAVESSIEAQ